MNCFIETFLEIISGSLIEMTSGLKEKHELLKIAVKKLDQEPKLSEKTNIHKDIMFVLAQNHFFDPGYGLTIGELAKIFAKSEVTIRKIVKELIKLSLVEQQGERPFSFHNELAAHVSAG